MNEEEWNALFLIPNGWATIPIIMMAGTLLNCPFITYTPLKPVVMGKKAAPDGVVRVEGDFTITKDWAAQGEVAGGDLPLQRDWRPLHTDLCEGVASATTTPS